MQEIIIRKSLNLFVFWFLIVVIGLLTIAFIAWVTVLLVRGNMNSKELAGLITSCVTYLSSLISIFLIIVKYIFPADEEKHFNDLVTAIITNDTERIKIDNEYLNNNK